MPRRSLFITYIATYLLAVGFIIRIFLHVQGEGLFIISIPNLSSSEQHEFADINADMTTEELLGQIGGAGHGKQNAVWKFNSSAFEKEVINRFPLESVKEIPVDTPDGEIKNLWTIIAFKKLSEVIK